MVEGALVYQCCKTGVWNHKYTTNRDTATHRFPIGFSCELFFFESVSNQLNRIFYCCYHIRFNLISADPELRNFFAGSKDGHIRMIKVSIANGKHLHNLKNSTSL